MKLLLSAAVALSLVAGALSDGHKGKPLGRKVLSVIDVGNKRPENCVQGDGPEVFLGEVFFGGVNKVNLVTGKVTSVVPSYGYFSRGAGGVAPVDDYLFVAGGGTLLGLPPKFYVYDMKTGKEVVACSPPYNSTATLFNDVLIVGPKAYFTDSQYNALVVADVAAAKKGRCVLSSIPLPSAQFFDPKFKKPLADGIVSFGGGLVISNFANGGLYFVDLKTKSVKQIVSPAGAPTTDGMRLAGNLLYGAQYFHNRIAVWKLSGGPGGVKAAFQGYLNSTLYDTPTGVAIYGDLAYACNARFGTIGFTTPGEALSNFTQHFKLVGVNRFAFA